MRAGKFFAQLKQRNVLRAGAIYIAAVWALAQGISQLSTPFDIPPWVTRWFLIACAIGFPFWLAFAWFFEFTPQGLKRESGIAPDAPAARGAHRRLNVAIFGVLAVAIVLLLTNTLVWHKGAGLQSQAEVAAVLAKVPEMSVAVLPFDNESGDRDERYFSDGLSQDMITTLSQVVALRVTSSASSFQFRSSNDSTAQIGAALGVAHLLQGGVQRSGNEVRITATLLNAIDGSTLWSQHYDRPYKNLFKLQDDIAQAVAKALKAKLIVDPDSTGQSDRPPSGNLDAYNAYLRASSLSNTGSDSNLRKSIQYFDAAIRLDPGYAEAYAMKSGDWTALAANLEGRQAHDAYAEAQQAADTALSLEQNLVTGHLARGYLLYNRNFDWTGALAEYRRALQLAPGDGRAKSLLGSALATLGQTRQAIELTREALLTDPLNPLSYSNLSLNYAGLQRLDDAERATRTEMTLEAHNLALYGALSAIEVQRGNAKAAMEDALRIPDGPWRVISTTMALQIGGDKAAADAALKTLIDKYAAGGPYQIAEVYALRKDPANLFKWLDRAWLTRDTGIQMLLYDPFILRYREDPRFAAFCHKVGLPTTTDSKPMR